MPKIKIADLKAGDVLLFHGNALISRLIRFFDGKEVNHAALYLGNGEVGEAVGKGVVKTPLAESIKGSKVWAYRLKNEPPDMGPVLTAAGSTLAEGHRYGYEAILLLALLATVRKVKLGPILSPLLRGVLDRAASLLANLGHKNRQPMICSEFVFRCYDDALPDRVDIFTLEIVGRTYPGGATGLGLEPASAPTAPAVHPQSLLRRFAMDAPGAMRMKELGEQTKAAPPAPISDEELDRLMETFLDMPEDDAPETPLAPEESASLQKSLAGYLAASAKAETAAGPMGILGRGTPPVLGVCADLVTPGDLMTSPSLRQAGEIEP